MRFRAPLHRHDRFALASVAGALACALAASCSVYLPEHAAAREENDGGGGGSQSDAGATVEGSTPTTRTYREEVQADGPAAYWPFDDPSGAIASDLVDPSGGRFEGEPRLGQAGLVPNGAAVAFDGDDDVMNVESRRLNPSASVDFTLEAIVKVAPLPSRTIYRYVLFCTEVPQKSGFRFGVGELGDVIFWTHESGGSGQVVSGPGVLRADITAHVAAVKQRDIVSLYVNGRRVATGQVSLVPGAAPFDIGAARYSRFFAGVIDEPAVYLHMLNEDRLVAHAKAAGLLAP
jgi:hypothetical protein